MSLLTFFTLSAITSEHNVRMEIALLVYKVYYMYRGADLCAPKPIVIA